MCSSGSTRLPLVVFTTAFDRYAVRAFEVNALDYLMKPVRPERLASVLDKARTTLTPARDSRTERPRLATERVFLRDGERCWIVQWAEIVTIRGRRELRARPLREPSAAHSGVAQRARSQAGSALFFRASRQHIVNLRFIESVETAPDDSYIIRLKNRSEVPVSRRQSRQLRESLGL